MKRFFTTYRFKSGYQNKIEGRSLMILVSRASLLNHRLWLRFWLQNEKKNFDP